MANKLKLEDSISSFEQIKDLQTQVYLFGKHASQQNVYIDGKEILIRTKTPKSGILEYRFEIEDWEKAKVFYQRLFNIYDKEVALKKFILEEMEVDVAYWTCLESDGHKYIKLTTHNYNNENSFSFHVSRGRSVFDSYSPIETINKTRMIKRWDSEIKAKKALIKYLVI